MSSRSSAISDGKKSATRGVFSDCGTCTLSLTKTSMDYKEGSAVWKTDRFLAACCRITESSSLEYILTRKCPLPLYGRRRHPRKCAAHGRARKPAYHQALRPHR